jgi:transcriptional regulator of NAD metabolism
VKIYGEDEQLLQLVRKDDVNPNLKNLKNKLENLNALSLWDKLSKTVEDLWNNQEMDEEMKEEVAELATYSAWNLESWDKMEFYIKEIPEES